MPLSPVFSKLLERAMQTGLLENLYKYNTLSSEQCGLQLNCNTDSATYRLTDKILNALNNKTPTGGPFVI
jgi:hypothetical protein